MFLPRPAIFTCILLFLSIGLPDPFPFSSGLAISTEPNWVRGTISRMTLKEKVGQLVMARTYGHFISYESDEYERLVRLVEEQQVGGLVLFQGDVVESALMLNSLQRRSRIPLLVAADFERGIAMRIRRGTPIPDAMAIGATRDPEAAYRAGYIAAKEARTIGVHQNLAPVADINNNPDNPVINTRSFGEDPALVAEMVSAFIRGTNDGGAISTVKHFPGHGDTGIDSHLDLPVLPFGRSRLDSIELVSFRKAIDAGVGSVMIADLEVPAIDSVPGRPATLSSAAVTGLLRHELGYQGLVVSDAMEMRGILKAHSVGESAIMAIQAGVDMILVPADEVLATHALMDAVTSGVLTEERIDRSVERVLAAKHHLGLDKHRLVDIESIPSAVGTDEHILTAREIARRSVTVLKNQGMLLPLQKSGNGNIVLVNICDSEEGRSDVNRPGSQLTNEPLGSYFSFQFRQRAGSVQTYRLTPVTGLPELDSTMRIAMKADLVVVGLFAKVRSSRGTTRLSGQLESFSSRLSTLGKPTIVVSFGNPYLLNLFPNTDAVICAYSDSENLVESSLEAMFGEIPVAGKLPVTIPNSFGFGEGLVLEQSTLRRDHPLAAGFDEEKLMKVDSLLMAAIEDSAFPGAQVIVARNGVLAMNKSFGTLTYGSSSREVTSSTLYDIASLTKVAATTAALMKLSEESPLQLDSPVAGFIPQFGAGGKGSITVRHLLNHTGGLPAYLPLYQSCTSPTQALDSVFAVVPLSPPGDTTMYSDVGMIVLGKVVESVAGCALDEYVRREFFVPLRMRNTMFTPPAERRSSVAPTELDTVWRKGLVQGSVHDENAELLNGVSGHAGLFSTASDLAVFMQMLMNGGTYGGVRYLHEETIREFTQRSGRSGRALGWDMKSAKKSSAGELFSPHSFGHTGFTGTSIWADPDRNLFVILLTNRVYPTRANQKIYQVRPRLHDAVVEALADPPPSGSAR